MKAELSVRAAIATAAAALLAAGEAGRLQALEQGGLEAREARMALLEAQLDGRWEAALALADAWKAREAATADAWGVEMLRGSLLARTGRTEEARAAWESQLGGVFDAHARLALSELDLAAGDPATAVRLAATLLTASPPSALAGRAVDVLGASFAAPRDCPELARAAGWKLAVPLRRRVTLLEADCRLAAGESATAVPLLEGLLAVQDGADLEAAERLLALDGAATVAGAARLGEVLFAHRDFAGALPLLERAAGASAPASRWAVPYAVARSLFWLERYAEAAARFGQLAASARLGRDRADALYQEGRALELADDSATAERRFAACAAAEPAGPWAPPCHLAVLRLAWIDGRETEALAAYRALGQRPQWAETFGRGALFLASSELVRGRTARVASWLDAASATAPPAEVAYWRGRLAELVATPESAVARYRQALVADPYDLFARAARQRLASATLVPAALAAADAAAAAGSRPDLLVALRLRGAAGSEAVEGAAELASAWGEDPRAAAFADLAPLPPAAWPPVASSEPTPAERLVALGLWDADRDALSRAFPATRPALALTRAGILAEGAGPREAVRIAEGLLREAPAGFPEELLPRELRLALHPRPFRDAVEREAAAREVDPLLLWAVMREESRFDPDAVSAAAAHGLTQFVLPTARRFASAIGRETLRPAELHRPGIAIALGAAYLGDLAERFTGDPLAMLAAYNAGEPQATLWRRYCSSGEATEYASKIGFRQTRDYVRKVLRSLAVYEELYGPAR